MLRPTAILILLLLVASTTARADSVAPPFSHKKLSDNGQYVFIMIAPGTVEQDMHPWNEETAAKIAAIRQKYSQSGLYKNDGSTTPVWTVDWYAYDVDIANDGVHLIRHGPWARSTDDEAFSFFANGKLIRSYKVKDLVDIPWFFQQSVSHFWWSADSKFDDATLRYSVSTRDWNTFVFDATTGQTVSATRWGRVCLWSVVIACMAVLVLLVKRRRRMHRLTSPTGM